MDSDVLDVEGTIEEGLGGAEEIGFDLFRTLYLPKAVTEIGLRGIQVPQTLAYPVLRKDPVKIPDRSTARFSSGEPCFMVGDVCGSVACLAAS
jgi:hypothetical protein